MSVERDTIELEGKTFEVVKPTRLREGMVLRSGDVFGRLGPKDVTLDEQVHTKSLFERGFPVPEVLGSGPHGTDEWYFLESSLGEQTFHEIFKSEYRAQGRVSESSFEKYLDVVRQYTIAQVAPDNRASSSAKDFIDELIPENLVLPQYEYFGFSRDRYDKAISKAEKKLGRAVMGILQFDLNPYNVLEGGLIDFELVGYGPIGYDSLTSARWGISWFTDYPSRYPLAYKLTEGQVARNDALINDVMSQVGLAPAGTYLQEFLLLKSAWGCTSFEAVSSQWPKDKLAFSHYRVNILDYAIEQYLKGKDIDYRSLSTIPGGEIDT